MDQVLEMMEDLAIDESSSFYWYVDLDYEFDASQYFDFSAEETKFDVREAERWFRYARDYPPAPYMMKINLNNILKSVPTNVEASPSVKLEAVEHTSSTITTLSDSGMHSSDGRTKDGSDLKYPNLIDDIKKFRVKFKSANRLSKQSPSTTFMTPTASHLAKKTIAVDTHANSCGRSSKLQTPTGSETENIKRQKLEIGFLRKATIPQRPKLMTEERALRRRSKSKVEADNHTFKALPLNRKVGCTSFISSIPLFLSLFRLTNVAQLVHRSASLDLYNKDIK
ncbi:hypothetical protein QVD17_31110 [Tagetes erecta]|uniref:TPX2 central domain-containing protein n=1 Tax=Tagetes erecta TaxID=13708 RepID=A0AAD8K947_TARER|nr:hypothetical protein QVD17_31110 [Tagetes erecta]